MKKFKVVTLFIFIILIYDSGINGKPLTEDDLVTNNIIFKDTVNNFVFDSINNNFGEILITKQNYKHKRYFKYLGDDSVEIDRPWTSDPHYICEFPRGNLKKDSIYSYVICMSRQRKSFKFNKQMGFKMSTGEKIRIKLRGVYLVDKDFVKNFNRHPSSSSEIIFKDTINDFVFDSLNNDLRNTLITKDNYRLMRFFKYIGDDSVKINRTWSSDPHFICGSPNGYLKKDSIYSYNICIAYRNEPYKFKKQMGFYFSDSNRIKITIYGPYLVEHKP